jgi:hypothetical protein
VTAFRFPAADLRVQRLEDPLPEGSYDLVVSALTIHHLDDAGMLHIALCWVVENNAVSVLIGCVQRAA